MATEEFISAKKQGNLENNSHLLKKLIVCYRNLQEKNTTFHNLKHKFKIFKLRYYLTLYKSEV